jgi:hypothetical protein
MGEKMSDKKYHCAGMHCETGEHYEIEAFAQNISQALFDFEDFIKAMYNININRLSELVITEIIENDTN